jgi:sortase A
VRRRLLVLVAGLAASAACGTAAAGGPAGDGAVEPATTARTASPEAPAATTTTWPLSVPEVLPDNEDGYYDQPIAEIGRLAVPALGLDGALHEGLSLDNIDLGPSHWPGTAMPGHLGNVVVAGHRVTHSRPFRDIDDLVPGDTVTFTTADGSFTYEFVTSEIVTPDRVDIATQYPAYTATLFACHPPGSARERYVAYFRLTSAPAAGQPDPSTLPPFAFPDLPS